MIFCGDIALPYKGIIKFKNLPNGLAEKNWIGNLEGSLIEAGERSSKLLAKRIVFNSKDAVLQLLQEINFCAFSLANNHILDAGSVKSSISALEEMGVPYFGAGIDSFSAEKELLIDDEGHKYVIVSFGWEAIKCKYADVNKEGVNPYTTEHVLEEAKRLIYKYPDRRIIFFFHWNYELELYPQPMDRTLAKKLIDLGVFAVIGCHAHRVQPMEIINGHLVAYGLGNFAFPQSVYMNGNLKFPDCSLKESAIEIDADDRIIVHDFIFDRQTSVLQYIRSRPVEEAIFMDLDDDSYIEFFRKNRVQHTFLPIFKASDSKSQIKVKLFWVEMRNKIISLLAKNYGLFTAVKKVTKTISK